MEACSALSLLRVPEGTRAAVRAIDAEGAVRAKLHALGFTPGAEVEVCPACGSRGGRRVRLRGASLVLDDATAGCVLCAPAMMTGAENEA